MCAVCGDRAKGKPGQKLPSKAVACEQCTANVKKSIREEIERESPTKRFLMKLASNLSGQLPAAIVQDAMKRARGHAGGTGKITRIIEKNGINNDKKTKIEKAAGVLEKSLVDYRDKATKEEMQQGRICVSCDFFDIEDDKGVCQLVKGDIEQFGTCELFKPGEYTVIKSQPDSSDVHVDGLFQDKEMIALCKFESPEDADESI